MLRGEVLPVSRYTEEETAAMYALMAEFYDNTDRDVFYRDFYDKDYCLALYSEEGVLVGFTTQKLVELEVEGKKISGIFSGDTIIHRDYWGDTGLFRTWARFWFKFAEQYEEFYWFLICKGYKTYRILPLFWTEFYPRAGTETPTYEQSIIDAYASGLYPDEYNPKSGVIEYRSVKDKLKAGVADIGRRELKNRDIAYFCERNPGYVDGNDLACLARIDRSRLKKQVPGLLFDES